MAKKIVTMIFMLIVVTALLSGCGPSMALKKGQANVIVNENSIVLLSVKMSNINNPSFQPQASFIYILTDRDTATINDSTSSTTSGNRSSFAFDIPVASVKNQYNEYLVSLPLKSGKHTLEYIEFSVNELFLATARRAIWLKIDYDVKHNSVIYAGRIAATIRPRKDDEPRAGAIIKALAGIPLESFDITGSLDIEILDNYDDDMKVFLKEFPGLKNITVEKNIMGPWVRPKE